MIAFAALSGPLPRLGVIVVAVLAATAMLAAGRRATAWAMLGALVLAPVLLLADIWHSPQLGIIHRHPLEAAIGATIVLIVLLAVAAGIARRPHWLGPLAVLTLPFRVPVSAGGTTANLLVPLYFVVAAGALAWIVPELLGRQRSRALPRHRPHLFEWLLAGYVVLYAVQSLYSVDFEKAMQNMVFFYVPFALLLRQLRDLTWDRNLLSRCLGVTVALAVIFACIGYVEYATKTLLLNPKLIAANDIHPYFTVNSVFFDPDIFGRYLALVMILLVAVLVYDRRPRIALGSIIALALLWAGLVLTLSRSSLGALLLGMALLAALRWRVRPVLIVVAVVVLAGVVAVVVSPSTFGLNQGLNGASSGRANLITGGLQMFGDRPAGGYGSGGFVTEYQRQHPASAATVSASHTIAITIAAEQGVIGLLVYASLVIAAVLTLLRGARGDPSRAAIAAAFLALILHTELYADFLEDPVTWTLLGIGGALATEWSRSRYAAERRHRRDRLDVARV